MKKLGEQSLAADRDDAAPDAGVSGMGKLNLY